MTDHDSLWLPVHEAAHVAACILTGTRWSRATIAPDDPSIAGGVWFDDDGTNVEARAFIFWAGIWAEARWCGFSVADAIGSTHLDVDRAGFAAVLDADPSAAKDWHAALTEQWPLIERIAVSLLVHGSLLPTDDLVPPSFAHRYLHGDRCGPVLPQDRPGITAKADTIDGLAASVVSLLCAGSSPSVQSAEGDAAHPSVPLHPNETDEFRRLRAESNQLLGIIGTDPEGETWLLKQS